MIPAPTASPTFTTSSITCVYVIGTDAAPASWDQLSYSPASPSGLLF
jgi:hypothetical protein